MFFCNRTTSHSSTPRDAWVTRLGHNCKSHTHVLTGPTTLSRPPPPRVHVTGSRAEHSPAAWLSPARTRGATLEAVGLAAHHVLGAETLPATLRPGFLPRLGPTALLGAAPRCLRCVPPAGVLRPLPVPPALQPHPPAGRVPTWGLSDADRPGTAWRSAPLGVGLTWLLPSRLLRARAAGASTGCTSRSSAPAREGPRAFQGFMVEFQKMHSRVTGAAVSRETCLRHCDRPHT